jgi:diguanylate cyclase (GGDEF)-like protein
MAKEVTAQLDWSSGETIGSGGSTARRGQPAPNVRGRGFSTLRARLLSLVLLAVLPAVAVIIDTGIEQRRSAVREAQENALRLVRLVARDHAHLIQEGRQLLTALAEIPEVRRAEPGKCSAFLRPLAARDQRFANFGVIRPDGEIACSGVPLKSRINTADRAYFRRALENRGFAVGDYQIGRVTKVPVLVLAFPAYNAGGQLESVVYAALDLGWLNHVATQAALPPTARLTVLDKTGTALAHVPESEERVGQNDPILARLALEHAARHEAKTTEKTGPDGERHLYAHAYLEGLPAGSDVRVVADMPARYAYAESDRLFVRNLLLLGVLAALVVGLAWFGGEALILRRSHLLATTAERLAAGDLSARTRMKAGGDELAVVGATFDHMADALERRTREAEEHAGRVVRLNRVYAVLSGINSAILRIRDRDALLQEACRIAVELGQFRLAWVALVDDRAHVVRAVASAGEGRAYVEGLRISLDPSVPEAQGPTATALREVRHVVCNDIEHDPRMAPWRERAQALGLAASAAFPLQVAGRVVGALNLYAAETGFFDAEETRLLEELAADTSLGLEHIDQERRINYLAYHDPLTDLPNINLFLDRLTQALARARHHQRVLAVVVFDIEGFRDTVSAVGRHAGDAILQAAAGYLADAVREGDTVARLEGDEFGVVLADVARLDDVVQVTERIARSFPRSIGRVGEEVFLKVHTGVAVHPNDGDDAETLLKHARLALRAATAERAATVSFYAHGFNEAAQERRRIEQALHHALERGEITLHYQPVIELASGRLVGLEALARWTSLELGPVSPAAFIPIAEETGLIVPLGEWVLRGAVCQQQAWHAQGLSTGKIALNVSARQLREPDFVQRVRGILEEIAWDPHGGTLAIEVTETEIMDDVEKSVSVLRELQELGLSIYVDDFGTGYSSLGYLQKLPVDTLKVDQGFVRGLDADTESVALVRAIIALARALGLKVIAEGVESEGQLAALRELGCDAAQGFLLARPMPPDGVVELLERLFAN